MKNIIAIVVVSILLELSLAAIDSDLVTDLPGLKFKPTFKHYSGYLNATGTRRLHYWFVESQNNPASDPVLLWLNGGPGCSSLDGMLSEHGPFKVTDDGKSINENPYAWNKIANVLYLEAPAGVGFSYATDRNYTTNDDQTSLDNLWALKYFMKHYSEFSKNPFYVTGESYGGIYVPTLANRVMDDKDFKLKGFAVGNGLSDRGMNEDSLIYFGYFHGLYGKTSWTKLLNVCCNGSEIQCRFSQTTKVECMEEVAKIQTAFDGLNIYNLYEECYHGKQNKKLKSKYHPLNLYFTPTRHTQQRIKEIASLPKEEVTTVPPCINADGMTTYLNTAAVKKALHIHDGLPTWAVCSDHIDYHPQYDNMRNQYLNVLSTKKYNVLVYNGDIDMACNFLGDEWFVESLGLQVTVPYDSWYYIAPDGSRQVAGFLKKFQNLYFATIKGAGHMVPQNKPAAALQMLMNFLSGA